MPELGEIKKGKEIGLAPSQTYDKFMWQACPDCGKARWVQLPQKENTTRRCLSCSASVREWEKRRRKDKHRTNGYGYVMRFLPPSDFFYAMAGSRGLVVEHRLVMAQHLGRCLHRWEVVHHKNHIKTDNRIENLQLFGDDRHRQITILENKIKLLEKRNRELELENLILQLTPAQQKEFAEVQDRLEASGF